ncbi:MAG: methylated-DNA-[protein]-cysteine S-methyltransferase [Patiriisocius sp.]|jgi:methylated-DNA-[protein]-cysteine S-methyltransferase
MDKFIAIPESNKPNKVPVFQQTQSTGLTYYVSQIHTPQGYIRMVAMNTAIIQIKFYEDSITENQNSISELAKAQMQEYITGHLTQFDLPLAPKGTYFQRLVWQQLLNVAYGKTASYLDIATAINNPKACRAVGAANGKNPIAIVIPCHRIIGANGSLTGYAGGLARKSFLLSLES